jgi:hypothetical protein
MVVVDVPRRRRGGKMVFPAESKNDFAFGPFDMKWFLIKKKD